MSTRQHLWTLICLLLLVGCSLFAYKHWAMHWPITPDKSRQVWTIELKNTFVAESGRPIKVSLFVPPAQPHFIKLDEQFISRNYGVATNETEENRLTTWTIRRSKGSQTLYYRLVALPQPNEGLSSKPPEFPSGLTLRGPDKAAAEAILSKVRAESADSVSFAVAVLKQLQLKNDNAQLLLNRKNTADAIALTAREILDGARIPTQIAHGILLSTKNNLQRDIKTTSLLGVWDSSQKTWFYINPVSTSVGLPDNFLIWWYGDKPLVSIEGGKLSQLSFSSTSDLQSALDVAQQNALRSDSATWKFSLYSLPIQTQQVYSVMIMIPVGAFIILILRNIVGLETFGTFMPVLVALAFRQTNLISGIALFSLVIALGLLVRFYLEHLKLLLVPRIAVVLSVVVLIMLAISIISYHLGFEYGLSIALFPMVIMTMTIERMSLVWEERSPWEAIKQGAGSLFAASIAYLAMSNALADHLIFTFPELILVIMGIMLMIGRYRGYRLSELIRFKSLFPD